jgi:transposase
MEMEAGSGDQHWAQRLIEMGHDAADARAIWMAKQMNSKAIAVKTEAQQDVLALHRMRQQLVKFRTMQLTSFAVCPLNTAK